MPSRCERPGVSVASATGSTTVRAYMGIDAMARFRGGGQAKPRDGQPWSQVTACVAGPTNETDERKRGENQTSKAHISPRARRRKRSKRSGHWKSRCPCSLFTLQLNGWWSLVPYAIASHVISRPQTWSTRDLVSRENYRHGNQAPFRPSPRNSPLHTARTPGDRQHTCER